MRLNSRIFAATCVMAAAWTALLAAPAHAAEALKRFNIGRQTLSVALSDFARQSRRHILFSTELVANKQSGEINGEMEPEAALKKLLEGTGLTYRVTADRTLL